MYDYQCEYCDGTVREKLVAREAFKHRLGFVILEDVPVGVCDHCGARFYHIGILKRVHDIATGKVAAEGTVEIPLAHTA